MNIDFESLNGTYNMIHLLDNNFNLESLFHLIPIHTIPSPHKRTNKKDIFGYPETIISARLSISGVDNQYKGVCGGYFPNSLVIDINTKKNCVNIKIWKNKIQTLGCVKNQHKEVLSSLFKNLRFINNILLKIKQDIVYKDKITLNWVIENTTKDSKLCIPKEFPYNFPKEIDAILARYLLRIVPEFYEENYDEFIKFIKYVYTLEKYTDIPVKLFKSTYAVIKYTYSLNRRINKFIFAQLLSNVRDFDVKYDQTSSNQVITVYLYYKTTPEIYSEIRRTSDKHRHTFEISSKGSITQSSSHYILAEEAFNQFKYEINSFGEDIYLN